MANKEKNFASAIIYVHNSEDRIENFLNTIIKIMEDNFEHSEIICVNDSSEDNSLEKIKGISAVATTTSISVVNMSYFHGLELSMNAGMELSIGDFVFEFDNTVLDFEPEMVMKIYYKLLEGFDIVSASADKKEKFTSKMFYNFFDRYTDISYKMSTESFRVLSRRVINRVDSMNKTIPYRKAVYANCGLRIINIKYSVTEKVNTIVDKSEKKFRNELAVDSLILFTEMGYRFSRGMTVLMMIMTGIMLIYSVVVYVTSNPVAGWTTTILFLTIAFLGLFGILTIMIKYLQLIVNLTFKRKQYNFESIEKLTK